jgi:formylmethanofuran dehydrogenase subunit E
MSAPLAVGKKKICVKCGMDVTQSRRMKDHDGNYWCIPCGEKDRLSRMHKDAGICEGCGESFNHGQLMNIGGQYLCQRCRYRKFGSNSGAAARGWIRSIKSLFGK